MTERLYYDDSYMREFTAHVTAACEADGDTLITLDRSAFYPTSGGQPYDTGVLIDTVSGQAFSVTEVEVKDNEVWHRVRGKLKTGYEVTGRIDWERRFDHMQQHGGEHMIAGAFWKLFGGTTIGLHLGKEESSIDVTMPDGRTRITGEETAAVEEYVNRHIQNDERIRCFFPSEAELEALPLRKPPTVKEHIRIVEIGGWELVACGGTHPSRTGEIGIVKILSVVPAKGKARVSFVCGMRAVRYLSLCAAQTEMSARLLSVQPGELLHAAEELKEKNAALEKELKSFRAGEYERMLEEHDGVLYLEQGDAACLQTAVSRYIAAPGRVALCGAAGRLIFARSAGLSADMAVLLRQVARGGGKPDMASGAGTEENVLQAAELLRKTEL